MPFSGDFADVYEVGIKQACKDAGAYCERVDEQIYEESILERVYNQISKADIIVAEMTGRNANVFYETGYAHALNKRVILLTQHADDIPFDLKHYPHIVYEGKISVLKQQLEKKIRWCVENPKDSLSRVDVTLELYLNDLPLTGRPTVTATYISDSLHVPDDIPSRVISLNLSLHNIGTKVLWSDRYSFALTLPDVFTPYPTFASPMQLPDGRRLVNFNAGGPFFPDSWHSLRIPLYIRDDALSEGPFLLYLQIYTELGVTSFPFSVEVQPAQPKN